MRVLAQMDVYKHTCTHTRTHTNFHAHTCPHIHTCNQIYMCACMCERVSATLHVHMKVCVRTHEYA